MSKVGETPISLPQGVAVDIRGNEVTIKGPKGELRRSFHPGMTIALKDNSLTVSRPNDQKFYHALHGLTHALLANMVEGVTRGFEKSLEVAGTGYRAQKTGDKLVLQIGYTNQVEITPPQGISFAVEGATLIKVSGIDKELVGNTAAKIRAVHPPDHYKGKGIRYIKEKVRLKPGKAGKAIGKKK